MKVMKFGGTSVGSPENLRKVVEIVKKDAKVGCAVVVSAFSGVTDLLLKTANAAQKGDGEFQDFFDELSRKHIEIIDSLFGAKHRGSIVASVKTTLNEIEELLKGIATLKECSARMRDKIASYGELLSSFIVEKLFSENGIECTLLDPRQLILTNDAFGSAFVDLKISSERIQEAVKGYSGVALFPGFIGATAKGDTTTLGRGGSDYTAAIVGAAINAPEIEIWTDVNGVMTADPRIVPDAISIAELSYEEAMELSHFGAKVIYPPTIQPAYASNIPLRIKNTMEPDHPGSVITNNPTSHEFMATGISSIEHVALLRVQGAGMQGVTGTAMRVFEALSREKINVILISQASSEHSICLAIDPSGTDRAVEALSEEFSDEFQKDKLDAISVQPNCSIIALVGENMKNLPGISGKFFHSLGKNGVNVIAIAQGSSELNISAVIERADRKKALQAVHETFFLSSIKKLHVFCVGSGLIGNTLLLQIQDHQKDLIDKYNLDVRLHGISNTKKMLIGEKRLSVKGLQETLQQNGDTASIEKFVEDLIELNLPNSVFVDCSASETIPAYYEKLLNMNISVVTPNKKGLASSLESYQRIKNAVKKHNSLFLYETSVGAGLPVINTLKDLLKSGDEILEIEAVLSGTLSYIFNTFSANDSFAEIVQQAKELGYTEPDPRDDLGGVDVGRKLLILAREIGYPLSMEDIAIQSLIPAPCVKCSADEFSKLLKAHEGEILKPFEAALKGGKKLCYIGSIKDGSAKTKLEAIGPEHPFFGLSGSDNIISFKTRRYHTRPLIVRGPGAGADVTAAGVFADILRVGA